MFRGGVEAVSPDEIRAAREAAGWTQEQAADAVGVLPVEVAAWESGAIALDRHGADRVLWQMERARYEAALPRSACEWTRANVARLERLSAAGPACTLHAIREEAAHTRECAECLRVQMLLRELPPPPEPPPGPGFRGWMIATRRRIDGLPAWLRLPLKLGEGALWTGAAYLGLVLLNWIEGDEPPSLALTAAIITGIMWFAWLRRLLVPLAERRPYLAGQVLGASLVLPATVVGGAMGAWDLSGAGPWIFAGLLSVFGGGAYSHWTEGTFDLEAELNDLPSAERRALLNLPPAAAGADVTAPSDDEERVVVIPQQAHWFKP